jgi:hypothetical protein
MIGVARRRVKRAAHRLTVWPAGGMWTCPRLDATRVVPGQDPVAASGPRPGRV